MSAPPSETTKGENNGDNVDVYVNDKIYTFNFELNGLDIGITVITNEFPYQKFVKNYTLEDLININKYFSLAESLNNAYLSLLDLVKNNEKDIFEAGNEIKITIISKDKLIKDFIFIIPTHKSESEIIEELQSEIKNLKLEDEKNKEEIQHLKDKLLYFTEFNFDSIILSKEDKEKIINWFKKGQNDINYYFRLIYRRGTNMTYSKFHTKCHYQGPNIVLCKSKNNEIFGGYCPIDWEYNVEGKYIYNTEPFIFSITKNLKIDYNKELGYNSLYFSDEGPDFSYDFDFNTTNGMKTCRCKPYTYSATEFIAGDGSDKDIEIDEVEIFQVKKEINI